MENNENKGIFARVYEWFKNLSVKGLLGGILVAFIIIIVLLSASYLPRIAARISSSLSAALYSIFVPAESATMTADKKIINTGEEFTVTFKSGDTSNGLFTVSYPCGQNINLLAEETNGLKNIDCDKPYYLLNNNSLKIKALAQNESVVRLVLTGALENNDTQKADTVGVVRVTVKNDAVSTVVNNPTPIGTTSAPIYTAPTTTQSPTYITPAPTYNTPTYYGKPDLAVRVLQIGLLNTATNLISTQSQFAYGDMIGIRFEVRNDGDATAGAWNFTASLPSLTTPTYNSPTQVSLRPGESIQFTLGFSNQGNQYSNVISINVDPINAVLESNEGNNLLTSTIINTGYNNNGNYNYNYNYNSTTGCYINGIFTYNCNNNNYNYNYSNGNLSVYCYATPSNPDTDERVHWYAYASGGNGNYHYDWTGTNSLNSSSQNPTKTYSSSGTKNATVTVDDGNGYSATQSCSVYVGGNNHNNNGNVDLSVEILAVGKINSSGTFVEDTTINNGDDAAVKFRVTNEGDDDSGHWDYQVDLTPSFSDEPYTKSNMSSLGPNESTTVTVRFNDVNDLGTNHFQVEIDPNDNISDNNRDNNDDSATIRIN